MYINGSARFISGASVAETSRASASAAAAAPSRVHPQAINEHTRMRIGI